MAQKDRSVQGFEAYKPWKKIVILVEGLYRYENVFVPVGSFSTPFVSVLNFISKTTVYQARLRADIKENVLNLKWVCFKMEFKLN